MLTTDDDGKNDFDENEQNASHKSKKRTTHA